MRVILISIILLLSTIAYAADTQMRLEIDHLIDFVSTSNCIFIRNGKEYDSREAVSHIKRKYEHFNSQIDSAERFIELSVSKSSVSNKPYQIKCNESEKMNCKRWLLDELAEYRKENTFK